MRHIHTHNFSDKHTNWSDNGFRNHVNLFCRYYYHRSNSLAVLLLSFLLVENSKQLNFADAAKKRQLWWSTKQRNDKQKQCKKNVVMKIAVNHIYNVTIVLFDIYSYYPTYIIHLLSFRIIFVSLLHTFFFGNAWKKHFFFQTQNERTQILTCVFYLMNEL